MESNFFTEETSETDSPRETPVQIVEFQRALAIERILLQLLQRIPDDESIDNGDNVINRLFQEETMKSTPTDKTFINQLTRHTFTKDSHEGVCMICMEDFKENDEYICLPCDTSHRFHIKHDDTDICQGIIPWLSEHNECPICRHKLPEDVSEIESDELPEPIPESDELPEPVPEQDELPDPLAILSANILSNINQTFARHSIERIVLPPIIHHQNHIHEDENLQIAIERSYQDDLSVEDV